MTLFDLLFLASAVVSVVCFLLILASALRRRSDHLRGWSLVLGSYLAGYVLVLLLTSLLSSRRIFAPGQRRCWDDWCVTAVRADREGTSPLPACAATLNMRTWLAEIQVSSVAKRVRQRAPDARVELEDEHGERYSPCATWSGRGTNPPHAISDPLGPGESFSVFLPFQLPSAERPAGLILRHGAFPGVLIIGDDSSLLHRRALQRISVTP